MLVAGGVLISSWMLNHPAPSAIAAVPSASSVARPVAVAPAPPKEPTREERIGATERFDLAVTLAQPIMSDEFDKDSDGATLLVAWCIAKIGSAFWWSDVGVTKDETSYALAQKDPDEARGKRMCTSGSIIQIEVEKTAGGKVNVGLMQNWNGNLFRFLAAGSSGTLVQGSSARMCGVVTGKFDYANSGGGTGHAIELVGMFDLPENKAKRPTSASPGVALKAQ